MVGDGRQRVCTQLDYAFGIQFTDGNLIDIRSQDHRSYIYSRSERTEPIGRGLLAGAEGQMLSGVLDETR